MRVALISLKSKSSLMMEEALKKYFAHVDHINLKDIEVRLPDSGLLVLGKPLESYDCVYIRGSFRYLFLMRAIASILPKQSFVPTPPQLLTMSHDKLLTHLMLQQHHIPMPGTFVAPTVPAAKSILKTMKYPIVFKFPSGTHGKGVMTADSYASAASMVDAFSVLNQSIIIQEFIEAGNSDLRIIVIGDKIAAAIRRVAQDGDKRANIHAGGSCEAYEPSEEVANLSLRVAKGLQAGICAIDIIESQDGPKVLEINLSPGLKGVTAATGVDVADIMAKYLYESTALHQKSGALSDADQKDVTEIMLPIRFDKGNLVVPNDIAGLAGFDEGEEVSALVRRNMLILKGLGAKLNAKK